MPRLEHFRALLLIAVLLVAVEPPARAADTDTMQAESVVRAFHESLRAGDVAAVERLLASDAVILEEGERESREQYLSHHLKADIEFAKAVPARNRELQTQVIGDVAWVHSTSVTVGTFRNRPVNLVGAELVVLARRGAQWQIQAVHWSSRQGR